MLNSANSSIPSCCYISEDTVRVVNKVGEAVVDGVEVVESVTMEIVEVVEEVVKVVSLDHHAEALSKRERLESARERPTTCSDVVECALFAFAGKSDVLATSPEGWRLRLSKYLYKLKSIHHQGIRRFSYRGPPRQAPVSESTSVISWF